MIELDELLILRLGLLALLLVFVLLVAATMRGGVRLAAPVRAPANRSRAALQVIAPAESGIETGVTFELAGEMTIGRDPSNSIVIVDPSVSGAHARIRRVRDSWVLVDLGSTNGTLLGSRPVDGRGQRLRPGDRLTIGAVVLRFQA